MLKVTLNLQGLNKSFALALSFETQVRGAYYTWGLGFSPPKKPILALRTIHRGGLYSKIFGIYLYNSKSLNNILTSVISYML